MKTTHFILFQLLALLIADGIMQAADYPLNQNDSLRIATFLNAPSAEAGKTNGQQLNPDYDKDNPATWQNFTQWKNDDLSETKRLHTVSVSRSNLKGSLDLTGCTNLYNLVCEHNALDSIIITDSKNLIELFCRDNKLQKLDLSGFIELQTLVCEDNNISQLDIRNSNKLRILKATNNNLTFTGLNMPLTPIDNSRWDLGTQKLYLPQEVKIFGEADYISEGNRIDLSYLGGKEGTTFEWRYASDNLLIPSELITVSGEFNDIFDFEDAVMNSEVYCVITNETTHPSLEIMTVSFELSYKYNINDLERLRAFLEKPSVVEGVSNGVAVNPTYSINDPRSFNVKWEYKDATGGGRELRVVQINNWDETGIAGELTLSGCDYLERLIVKNNAITSIIFDNETKYLSLIDCANNKLTTFDATKHLQLINLAVAQNQLTTLDISGNNMLSYLDCSGNNLNSLTLASLPNLKEIHCNSNQIKALSVELLENIERLMCDNNQITELKTGDLTKLQILSASSNLLQGVNLSNSKDLTSVYVNNNKLTLLNLEGLGKVNFLECSNNQLNFATLTLPDNIDEIPRNNVLLHPQDTIARSHFAMLAGGYISKDIALDLSEFKYPKDDITTFTWKLYDTATKESTIIATLIDDGNMEVPAELEGKMIFCELTCARFKNLTLVTPTFKATYKYSDQDVAAIRKFLDSYSKFGNEQNGKTNGKVLSDKYLSSDPTTYPLIEWTVSDGMKRLSAVNWDKKVELKGELDLTGCAALRSINIACAGNLERNDISKLVLNECENLETIFADYNQLTSLSVLNCRKIKQLSASNNKLAASVTIVSPVIEKIDLSNNKLSFMWVNNSPELKTINIASNLIEELNLDENSALIELNCSNNIIKQLNLANLLNLKKLYFANNKITSIDLSKQLGLSELNCNNNLLTSLNIKHCIELVSLKCSNNLLSSLDLLGINYLSQLEADGNSLVFTSIEYSVIANELQLNPQAAINPGNIDEKRILTNDSLVLTSYAEREDSDTRYTLRYLNGDIVEYNLYTEINGVITNFDPTLSDKSMYCEMTNSRYPGLMLRTVNFNTVPPMRYNAIDAERLRAFLDQSSKTAGVKNGNYLNSDYNPSDPATYQVTWVAIDSEFHLGKINWSVKPNLQGTLDLTGCDMLDTVMVTGMSSANTGIRSVNLKQCSALKVVDFSYNALSSFDASTNNELNIIIVAHNNISFIDVSLLANLEILDVIDNTLLFANLQVAESLPVIAWEPQKRIAPPDLVLEQGAYKIKSPTISLSYLGNNLSYEWKNNKEQAITLENSNGVFILPDDLNGEVLNCTITSNSGPTNGLTLRTIDFLVEKPTGIEEEIFAEANLYPNPTNDVVFIDLSQISQALDFAHTASLSINLYDATGKFIANGYNGIFADAKNGTIEIPVKQYAISAGTYYLQITIGEKQFMLGLSVN